MPWLAAVLSGIAVLAIDQAGKQFVLARPAYATARAPAFLALCRVINKRYAGFPSSLSAIGFVLCTALAIIALTQEPLRNSVPGATGLGLTIGGIASNFIDLRRHGSIIDFIAIGPLPVCNVADFAILGGLALTIVTLVMGQ